MNEHIPFVWCVVDMLKVASQASIASSASVGSLESMDTDAVEASKKVSRSHI